MKHILITGGAGFLGSHLVRRAIDAGHEVRILDNLSAQVHGPDAHVAVPEDGEFVLGDVTDRSDVERALVGIDTIVHLAAETGTGQSMYQVQRYYDVNVQGTASLFDVLTNNSHSVSNIVLASSRSVYGEGAYLCHACDPAGRRCHPTPRSPQQLAAHDWSLHCPACGSAAEPTATREDDRVLPASIYAATKLAQEGLVRVASHSLGIAHSILRLQNVYGEGQSLANPYTGILSIFSTRIRLGLPVPIFEDGAETRDFIHVEDVADTILRSVENPSQAGVVLNVGSGEPTAILTIAKLLCQTLGSSIVPHITGQYRIGDIRHNFADTARLQEVLALRQNITIQQGIRRFCDWVLSQPVPTDLLDGANAELQARKLMG